MTTWRDIARPIIAEVIDREGTDDMRKLRRALRAAYPFGERRRWPYKVWCHEIRVQLGQVEFPKRNRPLPCTGQLCLFGGDAKDGK